VTRFDLVTETKLEIKLKNEAASSRCKHQATILNSMKDCLDGGGHFKPSVICLNVRVKFIMLRSLVV
ncbi:MAG: hypothetical protein WAO71_00720, partial [Gallionella sp.]